MEMSSSYTEELSVKMRKPYTITKLREKWTEEEHSRFLDALKLYGRAWQRIEEHIGTKTAIQIRSHAQKFFTKLEKEAVTTGTPLGQAHDIDIPPPRPKKRPSFPYPRKTGICPIPPSAEAAKTMDSGLGKNSTQELSDASNDQHSDGVQCSSAALNFFKDIPTPSTSSWDNNGLRKEFSFREFVPMAAQPKEPHSLKGSSLTAEVIMEPSSTKQEKKLSPDVEAQPASSHPMAPLSPPFHAGSSSVSHISHPCPSFPPFSQFIRNGKELYGSFLGISSAFSNLLASSLLQNPAVHAAACMATSVWPSDEMIPSNMAAVASATVAAASAWWATNGLVPFFLHAQHGFEFAAPPTPAVPSEQMCQTEAHLNLPSKLAFSPSSDEEQMEAGASILMAGTSGKQQERSSCGSNTTSGSETETDAAPGRNAEANDGDELKPVQNLQPSGEACNTRRPRNRFCFNENWKEVSQEVITRIPFFYFQYTYQSLNGAFVQENNTDAFEFKLSYLLLSARDALHSRRSSPETFCRRPSQPSTLNSKKWDRLRRRTIGLEGCAEPGSSLTNGTSPVRQLIRPAASAAATRERSFSLIINTCLLSLPALLANQFVERFLPFAF